LTIRLLKHILIKQIKLVQSTKIVRKAYIV